MLVNLKNSCISFCLIALISVGKLNALEDDSLPKYKMCVPHSVFNACQHLVTTQPSEHALIECVPARDRMECLEKVNRREADFLAVDPEDMYVAFRMKNEDFSVFSEIRTVEEPDAEFRYEGIILVHKGSNINSLAALKGKKSCHTGYGRNVGYKIPITKLRKVGVLQTSNDPSLSPVEKELKGLSELFEKSCLVGNYSPNQEVNQVLKKRYSNLCALCEDPVKCNYPDKFSGYQGAIRCLVENGGDVAFTKVIYVRRFFGLAINGQIPITEAAADPNNYEYLCEDGSRRPVTGPPCSWAQRPWQGYMGNADLNSRLVRLQHRIEEFYEKAKLLDEKTKKEEATKLWISDKNLVVSKKDHALPGEHLIKAQYKDVIEREGTTEQKIRICVKTDIEMRKCETLKNAAYSRDIRPEFTCVVSSDCAHNIASQESDVAVLSTIDPAIKENNLQPVVFENYHDSHVIVAKKGLKDELLRKITLQYDDADEKSYNAALLFNYKRDSRLCSSLSNENSQLRVVRASQLALKTTDEHDELICLNLVRKSVTTTDLSDCKFDATPAKGVFARDAVRGHEFDNIVHAFTALSSKFGATGSVSDVFELFGEFEAGQRNVIFSDDALELVSDVNTISSVDENLYNRIRCQK